MNIPKTVRVGWKVYDVEVVTPNTLEDDTHAARVHHFPKKIFISDAHDEDQQFASFIHELVHCIFWQAGNEKHEDEWIIQCITNGLMSLLKDNPSLFCEAAKGE